VLADVGVVWSPWQGVSTAPETPVVSLRKGQRNNQIFPSKPEACKLLAGGRAPATPPAINPPIRCTLKGCQSRTSCLPRTSAFITFFSTKTHTSLVEPSWSNHLALMRVQLRPFQGRNLFLMHAGGGAFALHHRLVACKPPACAARRSGWYICVPTPPRGWTGALKSTTHPAPMPTSTVQT